MSDSEHFSEKLCLKNKELPLAQNLNTHLLKSYASVRPRPPEKIQARQEAIMRGPRQSYPGAVFHLLNRFVDKHPFFERDDDYRYFLEVYLEEARAAGMLTYAWCLMPNHFHVCIETPSGEISEFLRRFLTRVSVEMNRRRERSGHLFQGRSKTLIVEDGEYFETVVGYVLLNPVRAGMVPRPEEYAWSSAKAMLDAVDGRVARNNLYEKLTLKAVVRQNSDAAVEFLAKWMSGLAPEANSSFFKEAHRGSFLSSTEFRKRVLSSTERRVRSEEVARGEGAQRRKTDRPANSWTWEDIRAIAADAAGFAKKKCMIQPWANRESAERELTVWVAYTGAGWPYQRIFAEGRFPHRPRSLTMIIPRIRRSPGKLLVANLAMRCHSSTSQH